MVEINYNERSWAIDLISDINLWASGKDISIKKAGGENTILSNKASLFPDVLIFGDEQRGKILQGWELKLPDTAINDTELINNAAKKAMLLGLNSFIVWNVSVAVLYKIEADKNLTILRTWDDLSYINRRDEVQRHSNEIKIVLHKILSELDTYIQSGGIKSSSIIEVLSNEQVSSLIQRNIGGYIQSLESNMRSDSLLEDEINLWWRYARNDYPDENNKLFVLARSNLLFLINKFLLAHILKSYNKEAYVVDTISHDTSLIEGLGIFKSLSSKLDFWNVFQTLPFEDKITANIWDDILYFNDFLKEFKFDLINKNILHDLISCTIYRNKRKFAGQFTTPPKLAKILISIGLSDKKVAAIDPTCGSGTIVGEIYRQKKDSLGIDESLGTTWGSDKFALPLQMAMFNMIDPEAIGKVIQIFKQDATSLKTDMPIELRDPFNGNIVNRPLPKFGLIAANLPFVQQEDLEFLNPHIQDINNIIVAKTGSSIDRLDGRTDLYGYLPFYFWELLNQDGTLAIIISNSWLGTKSGDIFYKILKKFYQVEKIITSGDGRWFENASVITNILILRKKEVNSTPKAGTKFIVTKRNLNDYSEAEIDELTALASLKNKASEDDIEINTYSESEIDQFRLLGLNLNSLFADNVWLLKFSKYLLKASDIFTINRGERSGCDEMFYPESNSGIESKYLKPVLKTPRSINKLVANPDASAFCCTKSINDLAADGDTGAINWINKFSNVKNRNNEALCEILGRSRRNSNWYTMEPTKMAEIVLSMNPGDRLFFARLSRPSFANQRLICFTRKFETTNLRLCHAIMNSTLGLFYIEATGTGRGEGVLDLSKDKMEEDFMIINPNLFSEEQISIILHKFETLEKRDILPIINELEMTDRKELDMAILGPLGLADNRESIELSLKNIYKIRASVRN